MYYVHRLHYTNGFYNIMTSKETESKKSIKKRISPREMCRHQRECLDGINQRLK